jgi:hypothetical protein
MGAGDAIGHAQGGAHADGDRLFADVGMHGAVNPALRAQRDRELVEFPDHDHRAEQVDHQRAPQMTPRCARSVSCSFV